MISSSEPTQAVVPPSPPIKVPPPTQRLIVQPPAQTTNVYAPAGYPTAVQVNVANGNASNSLGISSLVIGILSFFICWIPFLGFGLSGLGFLLGVAAIVMSMSRKGSGIGYGIAGVAVNSIGVLLGIVFMIALSGMAEGLDKAAKQIETERMKDEAMSSSNSGNPVNSVRQPAKPKTSESGGDKKSGGLFSFAEPKVTKSEFDRIKNGMSYRDVVNIIGEPGEEISSNRIEGVPGVMESIDTIMYMWQNPGGSNMNAMFQNDKLMQKSQFGLK